MVVKAEANAQGTNRRFVVTNRRGAAVYPAATYDDYIQRGESENRHKEFKCGLAGDRLRAHRFLANYFRLYLHTAALNLLVRLRQVVALPAPVVDAAPAALLPAPVVDAAPAAPLVVVAERAEPAPTPTRRAQHNARRRRDPLGEGQPATWRLLLIKVAAEVVESSRRVVVRLSGSWPYLEYYAHVSRAVMGVT